MMGTAEAPAHGAGPVATHPLFGAVVSPEDILESAAMRALVLDTCDAIVMAGGVFWNSLEARNGVLEYRRSEAVASFATQHGLVLRGHTLVWHAALPEWVIRGLTTTNCVDWVQQHVSEVVNHFRGRVQYWDVLNEIASTADGRPDDLRNSILARRCGSAFVDSALVAAHAADADAKLGYNENGLEDDSPAAESKRTAVLKLIRRLQSSGIPLHYLGVQGHLNGGQTYSDEGVGRFLRAVEQLGVQLLITELDVDDRRFPADVGVRDKLVASTYRRFLEVVTANCSPVMVTTWGLSDKSSFPQVSAARPDHLLQRSLPFDDHLRAKPAWDVLVSTGIARHARASRPR
jgi:endo-1,4-beta-xylanase